MKNRFLLLTALICPLFLLAQSKLSTDQALNQDLETYKIASLRIQYDSLLYFMAPGVFKIVSKEEMKEQLKSAFENELVGVGIDSMEYIRADAIKQAGDYACTCIYYNAQVSFELTGDDDSANEMIMNMLEAQFGKENTSRDGNSKMKVKQREKAMIAFKGKDFDSWKFVEDKRKGGTPSDQEKSFLEMVLPAEVLEATK